jgi:hypothetical protein
MSDFDRPGATLQESVKRKPGPSRFGNLSDRLARTFGGYERETGATRAWTPPEDLEYADDLGIAPPWDPAGPRYPVARHGYDRAAVDEHVAELERELAELRARTQPGSSVTAEIERIGEHTSAILTVAHDKAHEMTRQAQEQADRCVADAAHNAVMITEDAKRRLRQIDADTDAVWHERARLVEDVRGVAATLVSLAEAAVERFPSEPERSERNAESAPVPSAPLPGGVAPALRMPSDQAGESRDEEQR